MSAKILTYIFIWGFLLGIFYIFILKNFSSKYKLLTPGGIPLVGGIAMALSFIFSSLVAFSIFGGFSIDILGIILASFLMLVFGVIDDWRELSILTKFMVQIIATALLIFFGIRTRIIYIGNLTNIIITFIWVIGITNAFNHLDIMDGLLGGVGLIISLSFFVVALLNADIKVAILSLVLSGAILSFLIYNFHPAKVYMGNAGSHFLGFTLAALAMVISYAPLERKVALLSPLLILGLPIYDTAFLILMRWRNKRPIFRKSNDHLTYRFLKAGYSKKKTLMCMYILGLFFSISGLLVSQLSNQLGIAIIVLALFVASVLGKKMGGVAIG